MKCSFNYLNKVVGKGLGECIYEQCQVHGSLILYFIKITLKKIWAIKKKDLGSIISFMKLKHTKKYCLVDEHTGI